MKNCSLVCVADYEEKAKFVLEKDKFEYYRTGCGDEYTMKLNRKAYERLRIRPRFLRNLSSRDTSLKLFGLNLTNPIGISPTAMHKLAHSKGELGTAKAAEEVNSVYILSCLSTTSIEEIAAAAPNTNKWLQIYIYKDRSLTERLIRRGEKAGFKALVVTIDSPRPGFKRQIKRINFKLPTDLSFANFTEETNKNYTKTEMNSYVSWQFDDSVTWNDLKWLINFTTLPIILKGILTKEDALLAIQHGCSGIIVSNHGGRQLDGVPATIEALPEITNAVENKIPIMVDGGIMQGIDVFKALALGANMVFIGRPIIWGLAINGQQGVQDVFNIIREEFELTMDLAGCDSLSDITRDMVVDKSYYTKFCCKL